MSQENERLRVSERFLESLLAGEPDMTLVTEGFEYQQHFGSTEGRYVGEEAFAAGSERFMRSGTRPGSRLTAIGKPPTGSPSSAGPRCVAD
jgi:hypothetical protein